MPHQIIIRWLILHRNICHHLYFYSAGTYCSNQDLIWCVNIGEYMVVGSIVGSDYYGMALSLIHI